MLLLSGMLSHAFDLTKINLAYQYDPDSEMRFDHRLVSRGDSLLVFFEVKADTSQKWSLDLLLQKGYNAQLHDTLRFVILDTLKAETTAMLAAFSMLKPNVADLLLFVFSERETGKMLFYDVDLASISSIPPFYPKDDLGFPVLKSYVTSSSVSIMDVSNKRLLAYEYPDQFMGADPAMGQMKPLSPTLDIDTAYYFTERLNALLSGKFYLVQEDSLSEEGMALLKVPIYYPELKRIEELIGAMRYITTDDEYQTLTSGMDTKANFERFWINTYGSKFRAKGAIRSFFKQVEASNMLFTDYKSGWKTDRGILYIVFGKPQVVTRDTRSEVWKYSNGITFEFIRISTLFAPSMYALKRDVKYEEIWYNRVGSMRK